MSYLHIIFWIPDVAGMTMLTASLRLRGPRGQGTSVDALRALLPFILSFYTR